MVVEDSHKDTRGSIAKNEVEANLSTSLFRHQFAHY